jgi:phosphate acetyltransferase
MQLLEKFINKAKEKKRKIVLPETEDKRIILATKKIIQENLAEIILIGSKDKLINKFSNNEKNYITFYDPIIDIEITNKLSEILYDRRKHKGMSIESAKKLVIKNNHYFGALLVESGDADGMVCGAVCTTGETILSIVHCVGLKTGSKLISSFFMMFNENKDLGEEGVVFFADCAVNPDPTSEQLASIAIDTASSFEKIMNKNAVVAMLSFSSKGSAKHELVNKVIDATKIAKEQSSFIIDGELQLDAAIVPAVSNKKAPDSLVQGKANCLIFPDLQSGNIGYKLAERFANSVAVGPIIQGSAKPINDLSRGCSVDDIFYTVAMTAVQVDK